VRAAGVEELEGLSQHLTTLMHTRSDHANYNRDFDYPLGDWFSSRRFLKCCVMICGTGCGGVLARGRGDVPLFMPDQSLAVNTR
jgi:hypothetical protein